MYTTSPKLRLRRGRCAAAVRVRGRETLRGAAFRRFALLCRLRESADFAEARWRLLPKCSFCLSVMRFAMLRLPFRLFLAGFAIKVVCSE